MDIKIHRMKRYDGNTKAFIDLIIDNEVIIKGFTLVEGSNGLFLGNPSEKGKDGNYFNTVRFATLEKKDEVQKYVISEYEKGETNE